MEGDFDCCGYEAESLMTVDTRNAKYQAKINHSDSAMSNKTHNVLQAAKINQKRQDKLDRERESEMQEHMMRQMKADTQKWAPVDDEDARHMRREAEKNQKEMLKNAKKQSKDQLRRMEEDEKEDGSDTTSSSTAGSKRKGRK